jgi:hypothetical protein
VATGDRARQRPRGGRHLGRGRHPYPGGKIRIGTGTEFDEGFEPVRPQGDAQVEHGRPDTDEHLPAHRVQRAQLPAAVDQHVDPVPARPEQPRLGVVHRRRRDGRPDAFTQHRAIDAR